MAERLVHGDDGQVVRLITCGMRELCQSAAAEGRGQQRRGHARWRACIGAAVATRPALQRVLGRPVQRCQAEQRR